MEDTLKFLKVLCLIFCLSLLLPVRGNAEVVNPTTVVPSGAAEWFVENMTAAIIGKETFGVRYGQTYVMAIVKNGWVTLYPGHPMYARAIATARSFVQTAAKVVTYPHLEIATQTTVITGATQTGATAGGAAVATLGAQIVIVGGLVYLGYEIGTITYYQRKIIPELKQQGNGFSHRLGMNPAQIRAENERLYQEDHMYNNYWSHFCKLYLGC